MGRLSSLRRLGGLDEEYYKKSRQGVTSIDQWCYVLLLKQDPDTLEDSIPASVLGRNRDLGKFSMVPSMDQGSR